MSLKKPLCIFHSQDGHQHCDDGFASAWIVNRLKLGYEFHYGIYQQDPPDVTDRDVLLVDFSYKREVLEKMAEQAESVVILDHHKSARDDLAGIPEPIHFDYWNDGHPIWSDQVQELRGIISTPAKTALSSSTTSKTVICGLENNPVVIILRWRFGRTHRIFMFGLV